jgi:hypothetical protein
VPSAHAAARAALGRKEWRSARRLLDQALAEDLAPPARADPDAARPRSPRPLAEQRRRPPHPGVACFELELGEDALRAFHEVQRLAPRRYEGFALAAHEHAYRRAYAPALGAWTRARALNPDLPDFSDVLAQLPLP